MTPAQLFLHCLILFGLLSSAAWGQSNVPSGQLRASSPIHSITFEVFVRSDMQSSRRAIHYAEKLQAENPGLELRIRDVLKDRKQLARLYELTRRYGREKPVVPSFHCCRQMYFGFADENKSVRAIEELFTVDVYTRFNCGKCNKAKAFIKYLERRWPAIRFRIYEVSDSQAARLRWQALSTVGGRTPGLPTFDFAGRVIIGYDGDESTGKELEDWIRKATETGEPSESRPSNVPAGLIYLPAILSSFQDELPELELPGEASEDQIGAETEVVGEPDSATSESVTLPLFGPIRVGQLGLPLFTLAVGLVDGFNPCAMWILVFLLSVLVNIKDRGRIVLIAGTFVVVSGLAYYAFMAAWLNMFLLIGIVRPVQIVLGLLAVSIGVINVKDFFAFKKGLSLSIPESQKPGLYRRVREIVSAKYLTAALTGAVALAVVVNMVELLCTAGLPAVYTQILMLQELPAWKNYLYLGLYILAYMFDDTLLLAIVVATLSHRKMQESEGRWLKLISGTVILILGLVMIFRPSWLTLAH